MRYTRGLRYLLFGIAWSLLLTGLFIPQAGSSYEGFGEHLLYGFEIGGLVPFIGLLNLLNLAHGMIDAEQYISIPLFLSELLFAASSFVLLKSKAGHSTWRSVYLILNVVCLVMLAPPLTAVTRELDPGNGQIQLLPGAFVWFAAQVALTLFAGVHWLDE